MTSSNSRVKFTHLTGKLIAEIIGDAIKVRTEQKLRLFALYPWPLDQPPVARIFSAEEGKALVPLTPAEKQLRQKLRIVQVNAADARPTEDEVSTLRYPIVAWQIIRGENELYAYPVLPFIQEEDHSHYYLLLEPR